MSASLAYIDGLEDINVRNLMLETHELIIGLIPQIEPKFKWKTPFFYYYGSYFCYLNKHKDHIYISFLNVKDDLRDDRFEIEHLKSVSKVFIKNQKILRSDAFAELILQAAVLHEAAFKK